MNEYFPEIVTPPGASIKDSVAMSGMTPEQFAKEMGWSNKRARNLFRGNQNITPTIAEQLNKVLGMSVDYLLARQRQYDESRKKSWNKDKKNGKEVKG